MSNSAATPEEELASASAPAPAPAAAPEKESVPVPAAEPPTPSEKEVPADAGTKSVLYQDILNRLTTRQLAPAMLRSYVLGPKAKDKLTAAERDELIARITQAEQSAAVPA